MENLPQLSVEINRLLADISELEVERGFCNRKQRKYRQIEYQYRQLKIKYWQLISYEGQTTDSGKPDKRTRAGKRFYSDNPTFEFVGPLNADLSPDKRSKEWKAFVRGGMGVGVRGKGLRELKEKIAQVFSALRDYLETKLNEKRGKVWRIMKSIKSRQRKLKDKKKLTADEKKFLHTHWNTKPGIQQCIEDIKKLKEELEALSG